MSEVIRLEDPEGLEVAVRRNARARRLSLRVSRIDGKAVLTAPPWAREKEMLGFVRDKAGWLRASLAGQSREQVGPGSVLPVLGQPHMVHLDGRSRGAARLERGRIAVPGPQERVGRRVEAALKLAARDAIVPRAESYARALGRPLGTVSLRDTRSRWGSCTHEGNLMLSWRLVFSPVAVLDYVVAHEVAHLVEMNHSVRFWKVVEKLSPDFPTHRRWLRENGHELHRWRFGD